MERVSRRDTGCSVRDSGHNGTARPGARHRLPASTVVMRVTDPRWPYLSPTKAGWEWIGGHRGQIRRLLSNPSTGNECEDPSEVVLDALESLDEMIRSLHDDVLVLVAEAHFRGASWSEIAHRLGRSKQTIHERYYRHMHSRRTHDLLRRDLAEARRRARTVQLHTDDPGEVGAVAGFLREHGFG